MAGLSSRNPSKVLTRQHQILISAHNGAAALGSTGNPATFNAIAIQTILLLGHVTFFCALRMGVKKLTYSFCGPPSLLGRRKTPTFYEHVRKKPALPRFL